MSDFTPVNSTTFQSETYFDGYRRLFNVGSDNPDKFEPEVKMFPFQEEGDYLRLRRAPQGVPKRVDTGNPNELIWEDDAGVLTLLPLMRTLHPRFSELSGHYGGQGLPGVKFLLLLTSKPVPDPDGFVRYSFYIEDSGDLSYAVQIPLVEHLTKHGLLDEMDHYYQPECAVGSIAVYHETKKGWNKYTTGKVAHIYRPWCEDSQGNFTWGKWEIGPGTLTKCIPIEAFEHTNATWWLVDATIGDTSTGAETHDIEDWICNIQNHTSEASAGTGDSISAYLTITDNPATAKAAIYLNSTSALLSNGATPEDNPAVGTDWHVFTYSTGPSISASTAYDLAVWGKTLGGRTAVAHYDSPADATSGGNDWSGYDGFPDPHSYSDYGEEYSVYCTYSVAETGLSIPVAMRYYRNRRELCRIS
jgi:hypothetical protein